MEYRRRTRSTIGNAYPHEVREVADEAVQFHDDDGTITCSVGGKRHRLRRPKLGEFRRLRETQVQIEDDVRAAADPFRDELSDLDRRAVEATEDGRVDEARSLRDEWRTVNDKALVEIEIVRARWVRSVFAVLSDIKLPEPDDDDPAADLEPWMVSATLPAAFVYHWRHRPLALGGLAAAMAEARDQT